MVYELLHDYLKGLINFLHSILDFQKMLSFEAKHVWGFLFIALIHISASYYISWRPVLQQQKDRLSCPFRIVFKTLKVKRVKRSIGNSHLSQNGRFLVRAITCSFSVSWPSSGRCDRIFKRSRIMCLPNSAVFFAYSGLKIVLKNCFLASKSYFCWTEYWF